MIATVGCGSLAKCFRICNSTSIALLTFQSFFFYSFYSEYSESDRRGVGIPGAGKGLLVSNALRRIKQLHPQTTIFYIDPKNDPKETGYFSGCVDVLKRASTPSMTPVEIVSWFQNCIKEFNALRGDKLLAFDEGTQIGSQFKIAKQLDWLKGKLTSYTSCGDSAGIRVWILAQNPHTED
ncbi:hypothetical protein BV372_12620 [Nostoc sp. T09]|nr:hypothetical protein BV372_12620 [Nostoc sp. T09]